MVPTRLLVEQQAKAISAETSLTVHTLVGGKAPPAELEIVRVLVSTAEPFHCLSETDDRFSLAKISLIVFDEAHHAMVSSSNLNPQLRVFFSSVET
jgi:superfamily II DNA or RNA helicase